MHFFLVEDDVQLGDAIRRVLERSANAVTWWRNGRTALRLMLEGNGELVLLDLGLPSMDGLEVLTRARAAGCATPVIVVSARSGARIGALDAGADDYLVKPFHLQELAAWVRSVSRRARGASVNRLEVGALSIEPDTLEVMWRGEALECSLYGPDRVVSTGAFEVLVHSLWRKLSAEVIRMVRGFGYMIPRKPE